MRIYLPGSEFKTKKESLKMDQFAILALMRAKPGKERALENFLIAARSLVLAETETTNWYAVRLDDGRYGIFDTFPDQSGRDAHLGGEVARQLMAKAAELLAEPPIIQKLDILASKNPQ
jgi:quinol monooxygenase YgiN